MVTVDEVRKAQRAEGTATIMAIGTANPPNVYDQSSYPDTYFRMTNTEHMTQVKNKMQRICDKSTIKKRYTYTTEEVMKENLNINSYRAPSLDTRQDMAATLIPELGKEAVTKAIEEWGQPNSWVLIYLLTESCMLYQQGCNGGGTVLRIAKDLAENNKGACVLIVCTEITLVGFHCPTETDVDLLVSHSLFSDGSAALIVGADLIPGVENPIFELISTAPTLVPNSVGAICGSIREHGLTFHIGKEVPDLISNHIENRLIEVFHPLVRKNSTEDGLKTTGEGSEWGVLFGFGPGLTIETLVLHSVSIA
ncbi:hypothetical protein Pint_20606 [Pistacia integerrima]|uniref:Uncharacterized protein n=1 Tax=Pistacia integerrima TaxID=434235 RepID=A0ACC0XF92_9ROSI|nr:hypothetical protein Pint_20606 [Pistacia integerrima]